MTLVTLARVPTYYGTHPDLMFTNIRTYSNPSRSRTSPFVSLSLQISSLSIATAASFSTSQKKTSNSPIYISLIVMVHRFILPLVLVLEIHTRIIYNTHAFTIQSFPPTPTAFVVTRKTSSSSYPSHGLQSLFAKGDGETGGAALAKPAVKIGQKTALVTQQKSAVVQKQKAKTSEPISRRDEEFQDAPMYKVMLVGDGDYDQAHVVERMCAIFEDMDENKAASVFKQAQQGGKAMCGKYPYEYAELYKEQLLRSDPMIYSDVEEENKNESGKKRK